MSRGRKSMIWWLVWSCTAQYCQSITNTIPLLSAEDWPFKMAAWCFSVYRPRQQEIKHLMMMMMVSPSNLLLPFVRLSQLCQASVFLHHPFSLSLSSFLLSFTLPLACRCVSRSESSESQLESFPLPCSAQWTWHIRELIVLLISDSAFTRADTLQSHTWKLKEKAGLFLYLWLVCCSACGMKISAL